MPPQRRDLTPAESVVGVDWSTFLAWFGDVWEPGQHVACIGPTGAGKSTFVVGLMGLRKHVLAVDPKGEDSTLTASGYRRIRSWPPPSEVRRDISEGRGARLIVGGGVKTTKDFTRLGELIGEVLDAAFNEGGWTLFIDELQVTAQMMRHSLAIQRNLVMARDKRVSMITAYQAPSWVPTAASRQATWLCLWPTRDEDVIKNVAAKAGRPRHEVQALLHELPDYHVAVFGNNPRVPIVITHPDEV